MTTSQKIESLLFYKTEPMSYKKIGKILNLKEPEIVSAIEVLDESLSGRGIVLVKNEDGVMLGTHPEASEFLEQLRKDELGGPLSKAALETLTIITYKNGIVKSKLDYIRGVNSNFIVRNLLMRGLVEKRPNPDDKRSPLYGPTFDTLAYLGIQSVDELPEYAQLSEKLEAIKEDDSHAESETENE